MVPTQKEQDIPPILNCTFSMASPSRLEVILLASVEKHLIPLDAVSK